MAEIKMDLSEFKEMEKNVKLLEKALKDNKASQITIDALKKEQLEALQNNSKVVTIVTETRSTEFLLVKRDPWEVIKRLSNGMQRYPEDKYRGVHSMDEMHYLAMSDARGSGGMGHQYHEVDWISDSFFDKREMKHEPTKFVTTKGLDEMYAEIREELKKEVTQEALNNIELIAELKIKLTQVNLEYAEVKSDLRKAEGDINLLTGENTNLEEFIEAQDFDLKVLEDIKEELKKHTSNMFQSTNILNKIKSLI